jgi:hypothetical protein
MEHIESRRGLIRSRRAAVVALCLTGFETALSIRDVFAHSQPRGQWLVSLEFLLPHWAAAVVNVAFYAYLLWLGVDFYRTAQGKERVLVAGWSTVILTGPLENLVSVSAATAIQWIHAASMVAALTAAVYILIENPASGPAQP